MAKSEFERRQWKTALAVVAAVTTLSAIGGAMLHLDGRLPPSLLLTALVIIFSGAIALTIPWWRSLDDMQKAGQYFSWYWGGTVGSTLAIAVIMGVFGASSLITKGAILLLFGQLAGFTLFWVGWRLHVQGAKE